MNIAITPDFEHIPGIRLVWTRSIWFFLTNEKSIEPKPNQSLKLAKFEAKLIKSIQNQS